MPKDLTGEELLAAWEAARSMSMTRKQHAESLGISAKAHERRCERASRTRKKNGERIADEPPKETVTDETDGNYRTVVYQGVRHQSVEDLLEHLQVDLTEWRIDDRYEVGSWEMGRKGKTVDLVWNDGRMDGSVVDKGRLFIDTLHRFKVPLVRIHPIPVEPIIQPVRFEYSKHEHTPTDRTPTGKDLVIPDMQIGYRREMHNGNLDPFHDRLAMSIVLQVAQENDFDYATYLGDFDDFTEWNDRFVKEPEFILTTQPMLIETAWYMAQIKAALPEAEHDAIPGNHEDRFEKYMMANLYQAYKLKPATQIHLDEPMSLKRMLGLDEIGVRLAGGYPNGEVWRGEYVRYIHGNKVSSNAGGTVSNLIKDLTHTTIMGHIHRIEQATRTIDDVHGRRYVTAACPGCLCRIDYTVPGHARGQNWQQGFGVVHYDSRSPYVELIPIIDGEAVYNGKRYRGYDYKQKLEKDTQWKF